MIAAPFVNQAGRQARDENLLAVRHAIAILVDEHAEERRVQDPYLAVLGDQAARVFHFCKCVHAVGLAVAVVVNGAHDAAAPWRAAERSLLVHGHKDRAVGSHRHGHRISHPGRGREEADLESRRGLDDFADRLVVDGRERSIPARRPKVKPRSIPVLLARELVGDRCGPLLGERPQVRCRRTSRRTEAGRRLGPLGPRRLLTRDDRLRHALDCGHIRQKAVLAEDRRRNLTEDLVIGFANLLDGEQPVDEPVFTAVGSGQTHIHELIGRPHHRKVRERQFLIARYEDEPVRLRVQEKGVIVTECEEAIGVGNHRLHRHEPQKPVDVEVRGDLGAERFFVALLDQADERDQAFGL